ncbi:MAG TPA: SLC13 family permease [Nitrospiria bacterium]|nr:SLC13 family permease [Nitrospiria bacterium]
MIIALIILIFTYLVIALQKIPRIPIDMIWASLIGAALMILSGALPLSEVPKALDWSTLLLLLGMMVVIAHLELAGFFDWVAVRIVASVRSPLQLLSLLIFTSGVLSAFFVNDTICLLFTPILLQTIKPLGLRPAPYLIALATASNIGSAMSVTGNPQNVFIGIHSGMPYLSFLIALAPVSLIGMVLNIAVVALVYRKEILGHGVFHLVRPVSSGLNRPLLVKGLIASAGAAIGFAAGAPYALTAMAAGAALFLAGRQNFLTIIKKVNWRLLAFFAGLFIVMGGARQAGVMNGLLDQVHRALGGSTALMIAQLSGLTVLLSNLVSNVPAVILIEPFLIGLPGAKWAWLALAMSSTLAGNLTLIGSVANLIVVHQARYEARVTFMDYLKVGVPLTLLTLGVGIGVLALESSVFG